MLSDDKKVAIDLSRSESIVEYENGSKIRLILDDQKIKEF
jgi:hypothetical protein